MRGGEGESGLRDWVRMFGVFLDAVRPEDHENCLHGWNSNSARRCIMTAGGTPTIGGRVVAHRR